MNDQLEPRPLADGYKDKVVTEKPTYTPEEQQQNDEEFEIANWLGLECKRYQENGGVMLSKTRGSYTLISEYSPHKRLDDVALAFPILEERNLLFDYTTALLFELDRDEPIAVSATVRVAIANAKQQTAALLRIVRANPKKDD